MKRQIYGWNKATGRFEHYYVDLGPKAARPVHGAVAPSVNGAGSKRGKPSSS